MFNNAMEIKGDLLELLEEKKNINQSLWDAILCNAKDQENRNDLESVWPFDHD